MIDINAINNTAERATVSDTPLFTIGMEIGLIDPIYDTPSKEAVEWYTVTLIEPDEELPIGWLYLLPANLDGREVYQKILPDRIIQFTDMVETISDCIVLPS